MSERNRRTRRKIAQEEMDKIQDEERKKRLYHTYHCNNCSVCVRRESIISANSFRIFDPSGTIKYIVGYHYTCRRDIVQPYYDTAYHNKRCREGNAQCVRTCETCKFGEPVIVKILHERKSGVARKWEHMPPQNCTVYRTFYRCRNVSRMQHFEEGTVMCSYMRCKYYRKAVK